MEVNAAVVHIVPLEDDVEVGNFHQQSRSHSSSSIQSSSSLEHTTTRQAVSRRVSYASSSTLSFIDQALNDLKSARKLTCSATSGILKQEALSVNKRLTAYHQRAIQNKKRRISELLSTSDDCSHRNNTCTDTEENMELTSPSTPRNECQDPKNDDECEVLSTSDSEECELTCDLDETGSQMLSSSNSIMSEEQLQATSIWTQAHRMKRMALLLRAIESNQRLLLKELNDCKLAAAMEEEQQPFWGR